MKHLVSILLLVFLFISCKEEQQAPEPEPPVAEEEKPIKTDTVPPPVANVEVILLDSGKVKLVNKSPNVSRFWWSRHSDVSNRRADSPLQFIYETNGSKGIWLYVENVSEPGTPSSIVKQRVDFNITTARGIPNAVFEGVYMGKVGTIEMPNVNTFDNTWGAAALSQFACNLFGDDSLGTLFMIHANVAEKSPKKRYEFMKEYFEVGRNLVGKGVLQFGKGGLFSNIKLIKDFPDAIYEVLKVEEVAQPKNHPFMYEKALWVTFRIKVDGGDGDIIDGTLRARYLIY